jgi:hypothetical protein
MSGIGIVERGLVPDPLVPFARESHEDRRALWQLCECLSGESSR